MALHEPLAMALHGSLVSLSDELFARPRADPRVLFRTLLHVLRVAACGLVVPNTTRSPSPPRAARVEGVVFRLVVNSAMPCLWPLLCVSGNTSSLEPVPRRSARCAFRRALLCSASRDRLQWSFLPLPALCRKSSYVAALHESALSICVWGDRGSLPWSGFPRFGLRGRLPPKLSHCDSSQLWPLRLTVCPRGQRALLDADMLELIDRSACLVEPVSVESCASCLCYTRSKHVQRRVRSLLADSPLREALWKVFCSLGLLVPSCSCRFTATLGSD